MRPEGANHLWRRNPPGNLSIDPVADERLAALFAAIAHGHGTGRLSDNVRDHGESWRVNGLSADAVCTAALESELTPAGLKSRSAAST